MSEENKRTIADHLKSSLPEFQQGHPQLDAFLDAAGTFLQKIKDGIEDFDHQKDYNDARLRNVELVSAEMGITLPRALPEHIKRKIFRDIQELNLKQGTNDDLRHTLRLIGYDAEVRNAWIQAPRDLRKGYLTDVVTGQSSRYDVNGYAYTTFLYGSEVVKPNGTFFEGYRFADGLQASIITDLPILGETYKTRPENQIPVAKTPYIIVRFSEGDFNANTGSYVDPDTGEVYEYTFEEEFELINEIIRYFTREGRRSSNVRVVIVVTLQTMEDDIGHIDSDFEQSTTYHDDGGDEHDDEVQIEADEPLRPSTVLVEDFNIGNPYLMIGSQIPFTSPLILIDSFGIGDYYQFVVGGGELELDPVEFNASQLIEWAEVEYEVPVFLNGDDSLFYPIRAFTDLTVVASDAPVEVYASNKIEAPYEEVLIATIPANETETINFPDYQWGFVKFKTNSDSIQTNFLCHAWVQENAA